MRIKELKTWLQTVPPLGLGFVDTVYAFGPQPSTGLRQRYVALTGIGGPGFTTERAFDVRGVQFEYVGKQVSGSGRQAESYKSAEELAWKHDEALMSFPLPSSIGGKNLILIDRIGSEPSYLRTDEADRTHFVCNYLFEIATGY